MRNQRSKLVLVILVLLVFCVLAALAGVAGYMFLRPRAVQAQVKPVVRFDTPHMGDQAAAGQPVLVHIIASGEPRIARVELWIDGQLHETQKTALANGVSPFPLVTYWKPATAGTHTLIARAFDIEGAHAQALIEVQTPAADDRDGDGTPDAEDACPDEAGWQSTGGCPDRDGDNVPDAQDTCPDEAGLPATSGCPTPAAGDGDGDGVPDDADRCPDTPGMPTLDGCPMPSDRDGDGIADEDDACPDTPGSPETGGCPDRDGDTVPDGEDACPDEAGLPENSGCPVTAAGDRDGDGLPDSEDGCPDDPGPPENGGCPVPPSPDPGPGPAGDEDSDGDGIPDTEDACPDTPGPPEYAGCPDRDGDTVPDDRDMCPDEAGPPENAGCPEGTADSDGDGVPDATDPCPDEVGRPEDGGCPPPTEDEEPTDGGIYDAEWPGEPQMLVEFQALRFSVSHDYDGMYCYPRLANEAVERHSFAPSGGQQWDIATPLGSRRLLTGLDQPVAVHIECGGDVVYMGEDSGWGTYWSIGSVEQSHPPADWDGHVITARSSGGDDGRWFEVQYRLCRGSCDDVLFEPPVLSLFHYGGDAQLIWLWGGDREQIDGFHVYIDGNRVFNVNRNATSQSVADRAPLCGSGRLEFQISAYSGAIESPLSNMAYWSRQACPRVVRVTFESIRTRDLGDDEWWAEGESVGPIGGNFWASGSTDARLSFNAVDYSEWAWGRVRGYRLRHRTDYSIQSIFDQVWTWIAGSMSSPYRAPEHNYVTVELGPHDDLTFGGYIYDADTGNADDTLFNGQFTLPSGEVRPGTYTIRDRNITLVVLVDVIVGPEVGREPDLTITNVDRHEPSGQLRIHVFNNAADMAEPADVTVHWVRVNSSEVVGSFTWQNVQIPSGGSRILQSSTPVSEIGGMVFVLDPEGVVPDGNRGNNTFEVPLVMRIEFLEVGAPHCSESGCSIFDCDSEWMFSLWAGHGVSEDNIAWVAFHERFPPSGDLVSCSHNACMGHASSDADWIMEGDGRYTFEFEMPANDNVYVKITGYELDVWTSDDPFASPFYRYTYQDNWGVRADPYTGYLVATSGCNDAFCSECGNQSVWARWRISRAR